MGRGRAENLKPWPKGTSGNPNGRPPAPWRAWLAEVEPDLRELFHTVVTDKRAKVATRVRVAEFLANHLHGQPKQPIEQEGKPTMLIVPEAIAARMGMNRDPADYPNVLGPAADAKPPTDG